MLEKSIKCFRTVVETGNFTRASEVLFLTQPSVSKHIAWLEREWGITLFERHARKAKLTAQGQVLYDLLLSTIDTWQKTFDHIHVMSGNLEGTLHIGFVSSWAIERFTVLSRFPEKYPGVQMDIQLYTHIDLMRMLENGPLDLIFQFEGDLPDLAPNISTMELCSIPSFLMLSSTHPLANKVHTIADLGDMTAYVLDLERSTTVLPRIVRLVERNHWKLHIVPSPNEDSISASLNLHRGCTFGTLLTTSERNARDFKTFSTGVTYPLLCAWNTEKTSIVAETFLAYIHSNPIEAIIDLS